jgi:hypothetical protein
LGSAEKLVYAAAAHAQLNVMPGGELSNWALQVTGFAPPGSVCGNCQLKLPRKSLPDEFAGKSPCHELSVCK